MSFSNLTSTPEEPLFFSHFPPESAFPWEVRLLSNGLNQRIPLLINSVPMAVNPI